MCCVCVADQRLISPCNMQLGAALCVRYVLEYTQLRCNCFEFALINRSHVLFQFHIKSEHNRFDVLHIYTRITNWSTAKNVRFSCVRTDSLARSYPINRRFVRRIVGRMEEKLSHMAFVCCLSGENPIRKYHSARFFSSLE